MWIKNKFVRTFSKIYIFTQLECNLRNLGNFKMNETVIMKLKRLSDISKEYLTPFIVTNAQFEKFYYRKI